MGLVGQFEKGGNIATIRPFHPCTRMISFQHLPLQSPRHRRLQNMSREMTDRVLLFLTKSQPTMGGGPTQRIFMNSHLMRGLFHHQLTLWILMSASVLCARRLHIMFILIIRKLDFYHLFCMCKWQLFLRSWVIL